MFNDAIAFYKRPEFCASSPVCVYYNNQPGIDTGGIKRQFFSDVLQDFAEADPMSLFVGPPKRLRPDNSPQVLTLIKILGSIITHSLVQEGPGFPFFAPFVYWYLVTSPEVALSYVTVMDLSDSTATTMEMVRLEYIRTL